MDACSAERTRPCLPQAGLGDESRRQHDVESPPGAASARASDGARHGRRGRDAGSEARSPDDSHRASPRRPGSDRDLVGDPLASAPGRRYRSAPAAPAYRVQRSEVFDVQARSVEHAGTDCGRRKRLRPPWQRRAARGPATWSDSAFLGSCLQATHRERFFPTPPASCVSSRKAFGASTDAHRTISGSVSNSGARTPKTWSARFAMQRIAFESCPQRIPSTPAVPSPCFPARDAVRYRIRDTVRLDEAFLWSFGTFSVPVNLWQADEPVRTMDRARGAQRVGGDRCAATRRHPFRRDAHMAALHWLEPVAPRVSSAGWDKASRERIPAFPCFPARDAVRYESGTPFASTRRFCGRSVRFRCRSTCGKR